MDRACSLAHQHKDHKLALLLSQLFCCGSSSRQLACYEQLDLWRRMGVRVYRYKASMYGMHVDDDFYKSFCMEEWLKWCPGREGGVERWRDGGMERRERRVDEGMEGREAWRDEGMEDEGMKR